jgi:hypothetical protein
MKIFRFFILICLLLPILSVAADVPAATLINDLQGVYKHRFMGGTYNGSETWQAEDVVEIVPFDDSHIYVRASLEFGNGHLCGIWGIAEYENGAFVYHEPEKLRQGDPSCTLKISATNSDLVLTDIDSANEDSTCSMHCGARGSLANYTIARSSKRKIRYLERLKASRQYLEAADAFKEKQSLTSRSSGTAAKDAAAP